MVQMTNFSWEEVKEVFLLLLRVKLFMLLTEPGQIHAMRPWKLKLLSLFISRLPTNWAKVNAEVLTIGRKDMITST